MVTRRKATGLDNPNRELTYPMRSRRISQKEEKTGGKRDAIKTALFSSSLAKCPWQPCYLQKVVLGTKECSVENYLSISNCVDERCAGPGERTDNMLIGEHGEQTGRNRLISKLATGLERRHGEVGSYLTQALLGHGCFKAYLKRFKEKDDLFVRISWKFDTTSVMGVGLNAATITQTHKKKWNELYMWDTNPMYFEPPNPNPFSESPLDPQVFH